MAQESKATINSFDVIIKPVITEKTMKLMQDFNKVTVKVAKGTNKIQIKEAFEAIFGVKVVNVNTSNVRAKDKRVGRYTGKVSGYKRAIVTLAEGEKIDLEGK